MAVDGVGTRVAAWVVHALVAVEACVSVGVGICGVAKLMLD